MSCLLQILFPQQLMRKIMKKKLFTLVAIAGLAFSTVGCAEKPAPAPTTTPPADATPAPDAAAPATTDAPPPEEKK
jgi:hypothetical protein